MANDSIALALITDLYGQSASLAEQLQHSQQVAQQLADENEELKAKLGGNNKDPDQPPSNTEA